MDRNSSNQVGGIFRKKYFFKNFIQILATAIGTLFDIAGQVRNRQFVLFSYILCLAFHHRLVGDYKRLCFQEENRLLCSIRIGFVFFTLQFFLHVLVY